MIFFFPKFNFPSSFLLNLTVVRATGFGFCLRISCWPSWKDEKKSFEKERKEECLEPSPLGFICLKSINKVSTLEGVQYCSFSVQYWFAVGDQNILFKVMRWHVDLLCVQEKQLNFHYMLRSSIEIGWQDVSTSLSLSTGEISEYAYVFCHFTPIFINARLKTRPHMQVPYRGNNRAIPALVTQFLKQNISITFLKLYRAAFACPLNKDYRHQVYFSILHHLRLALPAKYFVCSLKQSSDPA